MPTSLPVAINKLENGQVRLPSSCELTCTDCSETTSRTVRACAVRYRPRPLKDRMTEAARWHFILRQWVRIKPIHLTALDAAAGAAAGAMWRVSLQAERLLTRQTDIGSRFVSAGVGCMMHRARFHVLCLVTRSAASWSERCYSVTIRGAVLFQLMHFYC